MKSSKERGAAIVEYTLIVTLCCGVAVATLIQLSYRMQKRLDYISYALLNGGGSESTNDDGIDPTGN